MAKIFIGIALVAILATAVLGFLTKSNVQGLKDKATDAVAKMNKAEGNLSVAKTELKKAQDDVTAAKAAVDEKDKEVAAKASQVDTLTKQIAESKTALDDKDTQIKDLTAKLGAPKPDVPQAPDPAIAAANARAEKAEAELAEAKQVQETITRKMKDNEAKTAALEQYKHDRENQLQRPGVTGRILAVNPGWNFVVLNIGDRQGLMTDSPLLVTRGGEPIAKVRVTSIETSKAIADVIPGSVREGVSVQPGDRVVYQGSRNEKLHVTEPAATGDSFFFSRVQHSAGVRFCAPELSSVPMTIRLAAFLFLLTVSALLPACTNGDKSDDPGVSQIPWNKPENWESQGPMGGMMNQQGR